MSSEVLAINLDNEVKSITFSGIGEFTLKKPLLVVENSLTPTIAAFDINGRCSFMKFFTYNFEGNPLSGRDIQVKVIGEGNATTQGSLLQYEV